MEQQVPSEGANVWLDKILIAAIAGRASDVHFEPERENLVIRFRIDGLLQTFETLPATTQENIISRIKVLSKMDIAEHRFPQDGHFEFTREDRVYNIRVSSIPTTYGETVVFRILNREDVLISLSNIGLEQDQLQLVQKLIASKSGMVLTTGPTGSGKTNFLYSIINTINKADRNIVTLEDPIEYQMAQIRQTQINEGIGFTFAQAMRSVVRQDPDIVMLGEIRDPETAQMAVQAALTGILMLSTYHTFDIPALVNRFFEMGISNTVISQSVEGVISTRLVRKVCQTCVTPYQLNEAEQRLFSNHQSGGKFVKGKGCDMCKQTGYLGRIGIFEVVHFDKDVKASIVERKPASFMYELLHSKQVKSLRDSGLSKVAQGVTTVDEIIRVLGFIPVATQQ